MHLDSSIIIRDPRKESKLYSKDIFGQLVCIKEVADEVKLHYETLTDKNGKPLLYETYSKSLEAAMDGIEIIAHPEYTDKGFEIIFNVMLIVGWDRKTLVDNDVDIIVCSACMLDDGHLAAEDALITQISFIFSNDIILLPKQTPLDKTNLKGINKVLHQSIGRIVPLNFIDLIQNIDSTPLKT